MSSSPRSTLLEHVFVKIDQHIGSLSLPADPAGLYDPMRHTLTFSGKRLRPKLTILGTALGGGDPDKALHAGIAMELLHNFTLIHDDIMDNADTRRGKPTVYRQWGTSLAILSGDLMFAQAYKQFSAYNSDDAISKGQLVSILDTFYQAVQEVCEGQANDIAFEKRVMVDIDEYIEMIRQKTAALLSASLKIGGLVANADPTVVDHLHHLGTEAGIAFQIQDDLLDVIADPKLFGKKVGGDIREGKKTWLLIQAYEKADTSQKDLLSRIIQSKSADDTQIDEVIRLYQKLGIVDAAREEIERRYSIAMQHLGVFKDTPYHATAKHLFDALIQRDY